MEDITQNTAPITGDGNRKLRKIKRPVRRISPISPESQAMPSASEMSAGRSAVSENLDKLLDEQLNLPVTNKETASTQREEKNNIQSHEQKTETYRRPSRFITEEDFAPRLRFIDELMEGNLFTRKGVIVIAVAALILGFIFAKVFTGGKTVVKDGLQGVVVNAEVPRGRARCGVAERTQGCVLYIMNPQRQDLQGRDFYDLASQLTGRQRFVVETGNMRYSSVKIRPGDIAQINIPPLQ